jgi:NAD dependent epimerase/dehydratase family
MKINAIITGTTGMIGEGVLHECLNHPDVESVLIINRRHFELEHPKLKEIIHNDFYNFTSIEDQLKGYNACYHILGTTSVGKKEDEYSRITFSITKALADTLIKINPSMTFYYISGAGTDSSEKGKLMWANVKGKTENYLLNLGFGKALMFRPGFIIPTKGFKNTLTLYKIFWPILPVMKLLFSKSLLTLNEIGLAMINSSLKGYNKNILEVNDIKTLANK